MRKILILFRAHVGIAGPEVFCCSSRGAVESVHRLVNH